MKSRIPHLPIIYFSRLSLLIAIPYIGLATFIKAEEINLNDYCSLEILGAVWEHRIVDNAENEIGSIHQEVTAHDPDGFIHVEGYSTLRPVDEGEFSSTFTTKHRNDADTPPFLAHFKATTEHGTNPSISADAEYDPPAKSLSPLIQGEDQLVSSQFRKSLIRDDTNPEERSGTKQEVWRFEGYEVVKVPAGTFSTVRIRIGTTVTYDDDPGNPTTNEEVQWRDEETGLIVRRAFETETSKHPAAHELTFFSLPDPSDPGENPGESIHALPSGLIAYYPLTEGSGSTAADQSGFGEAMNLNLSGTAEWLNNGWGVRFDGGTAKLQSSSAATKINDHLSETGALSIEFWARPTRLLQEGPARIVSLSGGIDRRNITIGHGAHEIPGEDLNVRIRTTITGSHNGLPEIVSEGSITDTISHYVLTYDGTTANLYKDAQHLHSEPFEGAFTNWDATHALVLGNEISSDRGWAGELYTVAIYDRALTANEIASNFEASHSVGIIPKTLAMWREVHFTDSELEISSISGDSASPAGDGVPNLIKYALGQDPWQPMSPDQRPAPQINQEHLSLEFERPIHRSDIQYIVEVSDDLKKWNSGSDHTETQVIDLGDRERVISRDRLPVHSEPYRFIRLRIVSDTDSSQ